MKDVIPCNERFAGRGIANSVCSFRGAPSNKNYLCKCRGCGWKALPDKIRCFQTGCRAELADVLSLQQGPFKQKLLMALCIECKPRQELHFLGAIWKMAEDLLGLDLASHRSTGAVRALIEINTNDLIIETDLLF